MKKKILGLALLAGAAMLTSCVDPEQNSNDAVLQNNLVPFPNFGPTFGFATGAGVGINESSIPGFENTAGTTATEVTVSISALPADCSAIGPNLNGFTGSTTSASAAFPPVFGVDSFIVGIGCDAPGQTATANISFTAGGKDYAATYTLTSVA
ncbi:hypothetical protein QIW49_04880 [Francisellaceae bacterium CB300]